MTLRGADVFIYQIDAATKEQKRLFGESPVTIEHDYI